MSSLVFEDADVVHCALDQHLWGGFAYVTFKKPLLHGAAVDADADRDAMMASGGDQLTDPLRATDVSGVEAQR